MSQPARHQDIVIGPLPQVRFRVIETPTGFLLRDHVGHEWVNGAQTAYFYYAADSRYPENIKVRTEAEAWAHMPQAGYEILPPDEELFMFKVEDNFYYARRPEVESFVRAFEDGVKRCHIHTVDRTVIMFAFEGLVKSLRFHAV